MHARQPELLSEVRDCAWADSKARAAGIATAVLAGLTIWELTYPFNFQGHPATPWLAEIDVHRLNTLGNVALFMPWASAAAWWVCARNSGKSLSRASAVVVLTVLGAVLSALAETAQVWLPQRHSSIVDLLANTLGSALGTSLGLSLSRKFDSWYERLHNLLTQKPGTRRLAWALLAMLVVQTAPFDLAPETRELRLAFYRSVEAGTPFAATRRTLAAVSLPAPVLRSGDPVPRSAAAEISSAAFAAAAFVVVGYALARAIRQRFMAKGDRSSPAPFTVLFAACLVLLTEIMKWPIHSRTMNSTDLLCGLLGALLGIFGESARSLATRRSRAT